jgi:erythronate-4-phosphate dehydrogenase
MKIYFDENMPFAKDFFSDLGELVAFSGRHLTAEEVADADVLLVRSITQVNEHLLQHNKKLTFVGTATIGTDHIDHDYLQSRDIPFCSAPGCNAISVAEYVLSALVISAEQKLFDLTAKTVAIIGAGNTGTRLSEKLAALGINYVLCDPLLEKTDQSRSFVSLDQALSCDIISLHVPLTHDGDFPTYHLLDAQRLSQLLDQQILINACRGEAIDNKALLALKQQGMKTGLILDVWEKEPNILIPLIEHVDIATAHIAGYSLEGKARGTEMLYQALCQQLEIPVSKHLKSFLPEPVISSVDLNIQSNKSETEIKAHFDKNILNPLVKIVYDVRRDDALFRQQIIEQGFDYIRKNYPTRREFSAISVTLPDTVNFDVPYQLGFSK